MNRRAVNGRALLWLLWCMALTAAGCAAAPAPDMPSAPALSAPAPSAPAPLALELPPTVAAGSDVLVRAGPAPLPDGAPLTLLLVGSDGVRLAHGAFFDGVGRVLIDGAQTTASGLVSVTATADGYRGSAEFTVTAGPPVEPVTPLIGARTITADGAHWSMTVVVPFDRFGNPLDDGAPVALRAVRPDGRNEVQATTVRHLLAWFRLDSGTVAGRTTVAVDAAGVPGPEGTLLEVAGPPLPFALSADQPALPADGRRLAVVRTARLVDRFGNQLPDGTLVTLVVTDPDGTQRYLPGYTLAGSAEFPVQSATVPGAARAQATAFGVVSDPLTLAWQPTAAAFALSATVDRAAGSVRLDAGPVVAALGQYMPDGTPILLTVTGPDGDPRLLTAALDGGRAVAALRLADLPPGTYSVTATVGDAVGRASFTVPAEAAP